jgi:hypothetical protein
MSGFETSLSSGEAIVEAGGDDRRYNADSTIIETQFPTVAPPDASVGLVDALLYRTTFSWSAILNRPLHKKVIGREN